MAKKCSSIKKVKRATKQKVVTVPIYPVKEVFSKGLKLDDWVILITLSLAGQLVLIAIFGIPFIYTVIVGLSFGVAGWYSGTRQ